MAKQQRAVDVPVDSPAPADAASLLGEQPAGVSNDTQRPADSKSPSSSDGPTPKRWCVFLNAPTPVAHNPLVVDGHNEAEAKAEFCRVNCISGSEHPWTIEIYKS